jgi:catechol 2,3-dioxygenase-like lactoylglutathione lyase family enzyme
VLSPADTRGITVLAIQHAADSAIPPALPTSARDAVVSAVDHVVMFSDDLSGALALWRDTFGIREAWQREFPARGTVNVGLRLAGVTLELVAPLDPTGAGERAERLWGLAYRVADCDATVARLRASGVAVGDARTGLAPQTRVATVKWQDRLPSLLIEHHR